jgi:hypothetical protein
VRSTTQKGATLLDVIAKLVQENHPDVACFAAELAGVPLAAKEEFTSIATEVRMMRLEFSVPLSRKRLAFSIQGAYKSRRTLQTPRRWARSGMT